MNQGVKRFFVAALAMVALALGAWFMLPRLVDSLPGDIRGRLPDQFLELVTTPLPTALPVPLNSAGSASLEMILPATAMPRATATPTAATSQPARNPLNAATDENQAPTPTLRATATATATPSPTPLPVTARLDGLQVIPQKYNNCGPANLSIVLGYYGVEVNQLDIGEALKPNYEDRNVSPTELIAYAEEETGLQARLLYGLDQQSLKRLLTAGFPLIIEKGLLLSQTHGWMGHYLTLYGYDDSEGGFYGLDTFLGPWDSTGRIFAYEELDEYWAQFNQATVVIYPEARSEELAKALGETWLDPEAMWLQALETARQAVERDDNDAFAWFDLGASLYHLGTLATDDVLYQQSAAAFDRAREIGLPWRTMWYQFEPYQAYLAAGRFDEVLALTEAVLTTSGGQNIEETHLYRGLAQMVNGDLAGAERSYKRAVRLRPGFTEAQLALELLGRQQTPTVDVGRSINPE